MEKNQVQEQKDKNYSEDSPREQAVGSFIFSDKIAKLAECLREDSPETHKNIDDLWESIFGDGGTYTVKEVKE